MAVRRNCACCDDTVGERHYVLEKRVDVLLQGSAGPRVSRLASDGGKAYCGLACRTKALQSVVDKLDLTSCHPGYTVIASCSCCGAPVDRRYTHVSYAIMDITQGSKPWLNERTVHSDEEFAVLCSRCAYPDLDSDDELDVPQENPGDATSHTRKDEALSETEHV